MADLRLAVVMPFLDEAAHLRRTLPALAAQRPPPDELLLVDDGSTDGSSEVAAAFAAEHGWARVERRPPRDPGRDRLAGGAAVRAFAWGVQRLRAPWDVVAKLDADLELAPGTFATVLGALDADRRLGMAGPYVATQHGAERVRQRCPPDHVEGPAKFYTRACWEEIAPLPAMLGWDTIDEIRAHLRGFTTVSVAVPSGDPTHLRAMGSHDGLLRAHRRWGACAWAYGEHPLHVAAIALQRLGARPPVLGAVSYVAGYALAALRHAPHAEPEVWRWARRDTRRRVLARARHPRRPARREALP